MCIIDRSLVTASMIQTMARNHPIEDYRNFGIMAHIDAGKTTTTERIRYYTGKSHNIGADFFQCLKDIVDRLGAKPIAIQLPIGSESQFKGLIDLVRMKAVIWEDEGLGAKYHDAEIPADLVDQAKEYREKMIEAVVELDDDALAGFLDGKEPDEATIKRLLRKAVITAAFYPV